MERKKRGQAELRNVKNSFPGKKSTKTVEKSPRTGYSITDFVLQMQKTAGNRSVQQLIKNLPESPLKPGVIQMTPNFMLIRAIRDVTSGASLTRLCGRADEETAREVLQSGILDELSSRLSSEAISSARRTLQQRGNVSPQTNPEQHLVFGLTVPDTLAEFKESMETGIGLRMRYRGEGGISVRQYIERSNIAAIYNQLNEIYPGREVEVDVFLGMDANHVIRRFRFRVNIEEFSIESETVEWEEGLPSLETASGGSSIPGGTRGGLGRAIDTASVGVEGVGALTEVAGGAGFAPAAGMTLGILGGLYAIGDMEIERERLGYANGYTDAIIAYRNMGPDADVNRPPYISMVVDTEFSRHGRDDAIRYFQQARRERPDEFLSWLRPLIGRSRESIFNWVYGYGRYRTQ